MNEIQIDEDIKNEYDYLFKIVLIGDSGVGKSSVLVRFADDFFSESYLTTIGVDFRFKTIILGNTTIKLQLWDTAGQEKYHCITNAYYKDAHGVAIIFDTTNKSSFDNIKSWIEQIKEFSNNDPLIMLLGNKSDLNEINEVKKEESEKFARENKMNYFETSAKTNQNIVKAFASFSDQLCQKEIEKGNSNEKEKFEKNAMNFKSHLNSSKSLFESKLNCC